ncbi:MAG: single-stranded-DNA-specific exonuclease RecJ, partial [Armatimonadota bacterium]
MTGPLPAEFLSGEAFRWEILDPEPATVDALASELRVDRVVAALLVNRGVVTPEAARGFLEPRMEDLHDPWLLPDVDKAVERLARALKDGERIFVHGDYDADGVTSAALCQRALLALGADVVGHVPRREDGYDLQVAGVERALDEGASLILTSDCGIQALEAVEHAADLGIDVIITDHHRPGKQLPDAVAVVNPYRLDSRAPFRDLCGAGVAFKVFDALYETVRPEWRAQFRRNLVDLAALGTVADVTRLVDENRILVAHGLAGLKDARKTGIKALQVGLGLDSGSLRAEDIGFKLGPTLNAAGRMDDAELAYRLLTT